MKGASTAAYLNSMFAWLSLIASDWNKWLGRDFMPLWSIVCRAFSFNSGIFELINERRCDYEVWMSAVTLNIWIFAHHHSETKFLKAIFFNSLVPVVDLRAD